MCTWRQQIVGALGRYVRALQLRLHFLVFLIRPVRNKRRVCLTRAQHVQYAVRVGGEKLGDAASR